MLEASDSAAALEVERPELAHSGEGRHARDLLAALQAKLPQVCQPCTGSKIAGQPAYGCAEARLVPGKLPDLSQYRQCLVSCALQMHCDDSSEDSACWTVFVHTFQMLQTIVCDLLAIREV